MRTETGRAEYDYTSFELPSPLLSQAVERLIDWWTTCKIAVATSSKPPIFLSISFRSAPNITIYCGGGVKLTVDDFNITPPSPVSCGMVLVTSPLPMENPCGIRSVERWAKRERNAGGKITHGCCLWSCVCCLSAPLKLVCRCVK